MLEILLLSLYLVCYQIYILKYRETNLYQKIKYPEIFNLLLFDFMRSENFRVQPL